MALAMASVSIAAQAQVVATVGNHKITEKELDAKIKPQLAAIQSQEYELKVQAIKSMADEYVLEQAAKKENLTSDAYLQKHMSGKPVTQMDAKLFYDQHKEIQQRYPKYDEIKDRLTQALEAQRYDQERTALLDQLRKDHPVTVMLTAPRIDVKTGGHPEIGSKDAPVTIVEFSDFQCPFCGRAEPTLKQVREKYGDKVRLIYMDFPLGIHDHAIMASRERAGRPDHQGTQVGARKRDLRPHPIQELRRTSGAESLDAHGVGAQLARIEFMIEGDHDLGRGAGNMFLGARDD